ncbi:hypothetical protein B0H66DRAFT_598914 [Apodospora peruviana]|uniref:Uncharacterized protein n=1 Tax=Apodospora peruviana TaxID=516989 RepID=A0AAE0IUC1_9PEZI|nr:hypothetical protein B0H66DRAFT_598914 [Apodospora peruviana]
MDRRTGIIEEEFSSRGLRIANDKLPAISGVAREFGRRLEGLAEQLGRREAYVTGTWMGDILSALRGRPPTAHRRGHGHWAVAYPEGGDAFGRVTSASLAVRGFLGRGVAEGGNYKYYHCLKSGRRLGHGLFNDEHVSGRTTGWDTWYMLLWATPTQCFVLLLKESDALGTYRRVGVSVGVDEYSTFLTNEWLVQIYGEPRRLTLV